MKKFVIDFLISLLIVVGVWATFAAIILSPVIGIAKWLIVIFVLIMFNLALNHWEAVIPKIGACDFKRAKVFPYFGKEGCVGISCAWCEILTGLWLDEEYIEPKSEVDWYYVPIDTLVRVRNSKNENWTLQYFKGISDTMPNHRFETWDDGRTSKTTDGLIMHWKYCELVEEEDDCE